MFQKNIGYYDNEMLLGQIIYDQQNGNCFDELLFVIKRIISAVKIPVSVDFEAGYSADPNQVANYVKQLTEMKAVYQE